jgi:hypothetical protein
MLRRSGGNTCPRPDGGEGIDDVSRTHNATNYGATRTKSEALLERHAPSHGDGVNRNGPVNCCFAVATKKLWITDRLSWSCVGLAT